MARITVEDCLQNVNNRFQLVHVASQRVRQLMKGARPLVDNTFSQNRIVVVALREVAAGNVRPRVRVERSGDGVTDTSAA